MKPLSKTHLLPVLALCSFSASAAALGPGNLQNSQATEITRQVERKAGHMVERAMDRRVEEQVLASAAGERLAQLPATLPIHTTRGTKAFNDVVLDDGSRAVEKQWLVTGTASETASLNRPGITILSSRELSGLGMTVVRFQVTAELDSREALQTALPEFADRLDRNHIYAPQTGDSAGAFNAPVAQPL